MRPSASAGALRCDTCGGSAVCLGRVVLACTSTVGLPLSWMMWLPGGVRAWLSNTMRVGWRSAAKARTLSCGLSARMVPMPVSTAQLSARRICTSCRASAPVIHWLRPSLRAVLPSRLAATFRRTNGRSRSMRDKKPRFRARASVSSKPDCTSMPAARSIAKPWPPTNGLGSCMAATTRRIPALIKAWAQGPVRPVWLHGSSVT